MTQFAQCFLLIFAQLAAGGVVGLAVPPFAVLERGFYKSSAAVLLGCALSIALGYTAMLYLTRLPGQRRVLVR